MENNINVALVKTVLDKETTTKIIGRHEHPIYFAGRALKEAKTRCSKIDKMALTYVAKNSDRFQAHTISVITEYPLKRALGQPDQSGRIRKWPILLTEFDLKYEARISDKGHALADFLVDFPIKDPNPTPSFIPN